MDGNGEAAARGERSSRRIRAFAIVAIAVVAVAHLLVLGLRLPLFEGLDGWFWHVTDKPAGEWWLLAALAVVTVGTLAFVLATQGRHWLKVAALIALGYGLQMGLAWTEGRGLAGIRDRMIHTGHAEFASIAATQDDVLHVARDYEALLDEGSLGRFANTKPPGQAILYMATERLAAVFGGTIDGDAKERVRWLRTFAAVTWPLIAFLVLIPLFLLGRRLAGADAAVVACALYLLVPSVQLVTLHADQVFYPVMLVTVLALAGEAAARGSAAWGAVAGAAWYLAVYASFALAWAAPLAAAVGAALAPRKPGGGRDWRRLAAPALAMVVAAVAMDALFRLALDYDIVLRYRRAMAYHEAWKHWDASADQVLTYAFTNLVEFAAWLGVPIAALSLWGAVRSAREVGRGEGTPVAWVAMVSLAVLLAVALTGHTKGEVARLWLFLVPLACLAASDQIARVAAGRWRGVLLAAVLVVQAATAYLTKIYQDFY